VPLAEVYSAHLVVLAVKPQDASALCGELRSILSPKAVVLSVMAGVSCSELKRLLSTEMVARAMPNLGAAVGESATVYYIPGAFEQEQRRVVEMALEACGKTWCVDQEQLLDLATAVAGSGPAYLCWLGEQVEQVGLTHGLSQSEAHALVLQTFKGTVAYLEQTAETFAGLRARVTSPNGTTAAAMRALESVSPVVREAVSNALNRAAELGRLE
jgi:pyrroline-5-carboxylate reductase